MTSNYTAETAAANLALVFMKYIEDNRGTPYNDLVAALEVEIRRVFKV